MEHHTVEYPCVTKGATHDKTSNVICPKPTQNATGVVAGVPIAAAAESKPKNREQLLTIPSELFDSF